MFRSLKATLMVWVVVVMLVIVPTRAYFGLRSQVALNDSAYDVALGDWALALGNLVDADDGAVRFELNAQTEELLRTTSTDDSLYYVVIGPAGEVVAGDAPLAAPAMTLRRGERRLLDAVYDGQPVRMAVHAVECAGALCQVRVAETLRKRESTRDETISLTASLSAGGAALLALAIWIVVARTMRPLVSVNAQLAERSLDDLRPLRRGRVPSELRPLIDAVDQLLKRVAGDAARQRHFIADAAHQLRTPLTALRTETELALLEPHPPAVHQTLQRVHRSAQRVARLADQLLALARTEASSREPGGLEPVDLKAVAHDAAQDWVPRALERGADLGFQLEAAPVRGRRHLLGELLANLIHNALEYAGQEPGRPARITVRTAATVDGGALLEVEDNGPGIAMAERERVFDRFYRPAGSAGSGSGLGLAIVRDIAQAHGAEVTLHDGEEGRGLRVRVRFPAA
ncbi:MAG TPA: sensor histidine kinase N-terminal domain-containing protein [Methylibium sp.]|nr:sensor histidine kinase N-terminal domain-containing protein [Methylibium sp.]